jgi:hypothetical protein
MPDSSETLLAQLTIFVDPDGAKFAAIISKIHNVEHEDVDLHVLVESGGIELKERVPYSDDHTQPYSWHYPSAHPKREFSPVQ